MKQIPLTQGKVAFVDDEDFLDTKGTKLFDEMSKLVEEYGITAVTSALFDKVESNENWRQMDTLKETIASRM